MPAPPACSAPASPASAACACCWSTTPRRWPRRSASRAAAAATSPTATSARPTSCRRTRTSAARRWRATRRRTSSRWCSGTASPSTRSTAASCSATTRPSRSSACCWHECDAGGVQRWQPCSVQAVRHGAGGFELDTSRGTVRAAAGGGGHGRPVDAQDRRHRLGPTAWHASSGTRIVEPRPALVPLTFDPALWAPFAALAGLSLEVAIETGAGKRARRASSKTCCSRTAACSGPAVLQISSFWQPGAGRCAWRWRRPTWPRSCRQAKATSRRHLGNELAALLPGRLAETWLQLQQLPADRPLAEAQGPGPGAPGREPARAGSSCPPAPRAGARPRSRPAASTRANSSSQRPGKPARAGPALHRRGRRRHRLAGRLQLPVGLGLRGGLRPRLGTGLRFGLESRSLLANPRVDLAFIPGHPGVS